MPELTLVVKRPRRSSRDDVEPIRSRAGRTQPAYLGLRALEALQASKDRASTSSVLTFCILRHNPDGPGPVGWPVRINGTGCASGGPRPFRFPRRPPARRHRLRAHRDLQRVSVLARRDRQVPAVRHKASRRASSRPASQIVFPAARTASGRHPHAVSLPKRWRRSP